MSAPAMKQDMPPSGGYKPITYQRVPARSYFNGNYWKKSIVYHKSLYYVTQILGWALIGMYLGTTAAAAYVYYLNYKKVHHNKIEQRSAIFALYPLLLAEKDRAFLKQLRKNRDEEASLMANVEGWKVGTWFGEPIYHNYKKDKLIEPNLVEYYIHSNHRDYNKRVSVTMWS